MQKKILAVAVAGALSAPVLGFAQAVGPGATSTVQVFGTIYAEYGYYDQERPSGTAPGTPERVNVDHFRTSGSEIGFKGEERLGGSLSAWFQCASTADFRGSTGVAGWCTRNSALGMKGGFGNVFFGIWDTPFKRTYSIGNVGSGETGGFGSAAVLLGGTTAAGAPGTAAIASTLSTFPVAAAFAVGRGTWSRREQNMINYDSPNFAGFQVLAAVGTATLSTAQLTTAVNKKPRTYSIGGSYSAGPLGVGLTYERHTDQGNNAVTTTTDSDDDAWAASAAYTWGPVKFGGVYSRQRFERDRTAAGPGGEAIGTPAGRQRVNTWHAGVDWTIIGAHGLRAAWTHAGNVKGPGPAEGVGTATTGGVGVRPNAGPDTSANFYQIRYVYAFSKRTEVNFGYSKIRNKPAAAYQYSDLTAAAAGLDPDAWVFAMKHTF